MNFVPFLFNITVVFTFRFKGLLFYNMFRNIYFYNYDNFVSYSFDTVALNVRCL